MRVRELTMQVQVYLGYNHPTSFIPGFIFVSTELAEEYFVFVKFFDSFELCLNQVLGTTHREWLLIHCFGRCLCAFSCYLQSKSRRIVSHVTLFRTSSLNCVALKEWMFLFEPLNYPLTPFSLIMQPTLVHHLLGIIVDILVSHVKDVFHHPIWKF